MFFSFSAVIIFNPFIYHLLSHYGWRNSFLILAGVNLGVCGLLNMTLVSPNDITRADDNVKRSEKSKENLKSTIICRYVIWFMASLLKAYGYYFISLILVGIVIITNSKILNYSFIAGVTYDVTRNTPSYCS